MMGFSKYLLGGVTLLTVTLSVTWIQPYICVCVWERERERERFEFKFSSMKELGNISYS